MEAPMSKSHQSSRRRIYGRRQHEMHERTERAATLSWVEKVDLPEPGERTEAGHYARSTVAGWNTSWGLD
jgi:hypothetical protein